MFKYLQLLDYSVFLLVRQRATGPRHTNIIILSAWGLVRSARAQLLGPLPTCPKNGEGRDQIYLMSASLEKLVFLVNLSNPVCCHVGVWE